MGDENCAGERALEHGGERGVGATGAIIALPDSSTESDNVNLLFNFLAGGSRCFLKLFDGGGGAAGGGGDEFRSIKGELCKLLEKSMEFGGDEVVKLECIGVSMLLAVISFFLGEGEETEFLFVGVLIFIMEPFLCANVFLGLE